MSITRCPEYFVWRAMIARCTKQSHPNYKWYGARGITVCSRWLESFENFLADVGLRPSQGMSLDRRENEGNYEPGNVRWATPKEQGENTRRVRMITHNGKTQNLSDWARELGISKQTVCRRLKTMSIVEALSIEKRASKYRLISHNGKTQIMADWAREIGISRQGLQQRLKSMSMPEALTVPNRRKESAA